MSRWESSFNVEKSEDIRMEIVLHISRAQPLSNLRVLTLLTDGYTVSQFTPVCILGEEGVHTDSCL